MRLPLALCCGAAMCVFVSHAGAQDVAAARNFLHDVYAPYVAGKPADPLGTRAPDLFAPDLLSLIRQDQAASGGEAGLLDHDPLCACQDYDRLTSLAIRVSPVAGAAAKAEVSFVNGSRSVSLGMTLVEAERRWRIADVAEPEMRSLRAYLEAGLAGQPTDPRPPHP